MRLLRRLSLVLLASCHGSSPTPPASPTTALSPPAASDATTVAPPGAPTPSRDVLARSERYADLVRWASEHDGASARAACLVAERSDGIALTAELAAAVRPLPVPPADLDAQLAQSDRVDVLSPWGRHGDGNAGLALVSLTASRPAREAVALLLTDRGVSVRGTRPGGVVRDAVPVMAALSALSAHADATVFVAAEAGVPLDLVVRTLTALGARPVVLATALSAETKLPRPASASARVERCAEGLPETDAPAGTLPVPALRSAIEPLKERAADCLAVGDAAGAAGGRLVLALRVSESGRIQSSCIVRDELADSAIAACVLERARSLTFPPPSPSGVLDIELPLVLRPSPSPLVRPVCIAPPAP